MVESSGYWVLLGGRNINLMLLSLQSWIILTDMWLAKLSPITVLGPSKRRQWSIIIDMNQSSNRNWSNQPEGDRLYLHPSGPPAIQEFHNCKDLYTKYGGNIEPDALTANIAETEDFEEPIRIILYACFVIFLTKTIFLPGSSQKLVSLLIIF